MRLSTHCFAVTGLGYRPPWTVNAGFITGDETTLIVDTGANAAAAATIHGYATTARASNQLLVLDTERHFDHIGGNGYFRARGIDVYGHSSIQRTDDDFREEISDFNREISNPERRTRQESQVFYHGARFANPNRPITEDFRMDLGNCEIEVLLTPGHTPSNISVYVPSDGALYCGDCLVNGYLPNLDAGSVADWHVWLTSLERVAALAPRIIIAGHGPVATGDEAPLMIERVREILRQSIEAGRSPTAGS
jgi:glyoxylase-like metal-dependent hydrolase (beta-lactamase superfamily II)